MIYTPSHPSTLFPACHLHHVLSKLISCNFIQCNSGKTGTPRQACQLGKHCRIPFSISNSRCHIPFDIIHADLWTSPIVSPSGFKYYLILLDDFSHFIWTFHLRLKSDVFDTFKTFQKLIQTQFNLNIKHLQCDNGKEFRNNDFHSYFRQHGILHRYSCPHTSP